MNTNMNMNMNMNMNGVFYFEVTQKSFAREAFTVRKMDVLGGVLLVLSLMRVPGSSCC